MQFIKRFRSLLSYYSEYVYLDIVSETPVREYQSLSLHAAVLEFLGEALLVSWSGGGGGEGGRSCFSL